MMIRGEMLLITDFLESYISSSDFQTQVRQGKEELWFLWGWVVFFFPQINSNFLRLQKKRRKVHIKPDLLPEELALKKKEPEKQKDSWLCLRTGMEHSIEGLDLSPTISNPWLSFVAGPGVEGLVQWSEPLILKV